MNIFKNRTLIGVVCILISLGICFGVTPYFNAAVSEKVEIARVKRSIKTGDQITQDMIEIAEVGGYNLPSNVIYDPTNLVGSYALADFYAGDYILASKISEEKESDNSYLYELDGNKQAMSITMKGFALGLSGKLESGDIVSVIAPNYQGYDETVIPEELQYVEVISVTAASGADVNIGEEYDDEEERQLLTTITLLVTAEQSKILASLEADNSCHVSLVYRGDKENSQFFVDMQAEILEELYAEESEEDEASEESTETSPTNTALITSAATIETEETDSNEESEVE